MNVAASDAPPRQPSASRGGYRLDTPLLLLLCAGAVLRFVWIWWVRYAPANDGRWYYYTAKGLAAGIGYRRWGDPAEQLTAYWPVGYPAFLSTFFRLLGPSLALAQSLNVLLDLGSLALLFWIVRNESKSSQAARAAVLPLVFLPSHVAYASLTYAEPLVLFALLVAVAAWTAAGGGGGWRYALIAGAALGIGTHAKPQLVFVPAVLAAVDGARLGRRRWREVALRACVVGAVLGLLLIPWTVRNHLVFGRLIFVSTNGGVNLLIGNNPFATGGFIGIPEINEKGFATGPGPLGVGGPPAREADVNAAFESVALRYMLEHPLETLGRLGDKLLALYGDDTHSLAISTRRSPREVREKVASAMPLANVAYFVFLGACLLSALWLIFRRRRSGPGSFWWCGLALGGYLTAVHLVFFGAPRYHHPMLVLLAPYLGFAAAEARGLLVRRRER